MKTKLEMAHEYAIALINSDCEMQFDKFIQLCWNYADAMQAEADKREKKKQSEHVFEAIEEWQPDWSQAPKHMNYFFMNKSGSKYWAVNEPDKPNLTEHVMNFTDCGGDCYAFAHRQDYTGDWRNSLRKRPE